MEPPLWLKMAVLMPMSSPRALTSAPPELPGLIAASVWMKSSYSAMPTLARPTALTIPIVTVWLRPKGLPMASTYSPTWSLSESAQGMVGRSLASTWMTAMSVLGSVPTTLALSSRLSESRTRISSAFETTWLFVMMYPLGSAITPDPRLRSRRSWAASNRRRKDSSPKNRREKGSSNGPKLLPSGTPVSPVVEMFTTAGVTALATSTKLWSAPAGGGTATGLRTLGASGTACPIGSHPRSAATTSPRMTPTPIRSRPSASVLRDGPGIDSGDRPEQFERVGFLALEGVAPDDGPEPASVADGPGFLEEGVVVFLGGPAGEDHDTAPVKGGLHDVPDPLGQRLDRDLLGLVHLLRRRLFQGIGG